MKYPLVHIEFEDISTNAGWHEFPVSFTPVIGTIVGYIVHRNKNHVILASGFIDDEYGDQTIIPKALIRKIRRLKG